MIYVYRTLELYIEYSYETKLRIGSRPNKNAKIGSFAYSLLIPPFPAFLKTKNTTKDLLHMSYIVYCCA